MAKTRIFKLKNDRLTDTEFQFCAKVIRNGGVIALPTDTVYGLACNAFNADAIKKIYQLKGRSYIKPIPVLLHSFDQLQYVGREILSDVFKLTDFFWPGPLTLVVKTNILAMHASRGKDTIAVRVPDHGVVALLLNEIQLPLAATSANRSGKKAFSAASDVIKNFKNKVDVIIDGGPCKVGMESSVVDVTHYPFVVLREGAVSKQKLYQTLHQTLENQRV